MQFFFWHLTFRCILCIFKWLLESPKRQLVFILLLILFLYGESETMCSHYHFVNSEKCLPLADFPYWMAFLTPTYTLGVGYKWLSSLSFQLSSAQLMSENSMKKSNKNFSRCCSYSQASLDKWKKKQKQSSKQNKNNPTKSRSWM